MAGTNDTAMNIILKKIEEGIKGKDIKQAIHDGIEMTFNRSFEWNDKTASKANKAEKNATKALEKVNEIVDDIGEVHGLKDRVDAIDGRVDTIIVNGTPTEGNTELIDIRSGYNGVPYATAGTAVRKQVKVLNDRVDALTTKESSKVSYDGSIVSEKSRVWSNPETSPTEFAGTTINISSESEHGYSGYLLYFKIHNTEIGKDDAIYRSIYVPADVDDTIIYISEEVGIDESWQRIERTITCKPNEIVIGDCYILNNNLVWSAEGSDLNITNNDLSRTIDNHYLIPIDIYEVHYVLDSDVILSKDPEIIDARTGADGVKYNSLGEAIRDQIAKHIGSAVVEAINESY